MTGRTLLCLTLMSAASSALNMQITNPTHSKVLIIGGSRFSGLYLWRELISRGHDVTLFNRGKTSPAKLPNETAQDTKDRTGKTKYIVGDRKDDVGMKDKLRGLQYDVVYDMTSREVQETKSLLNALEGNVGHFVHMSSAGIYKKSDLLPHIEGDALDAKSRHKGKLESELFLSQSGVPFTAIRPTYIYGPLNYNPLEEYFFSRISAGRPVCIPGHGQLLTGLGHVQDLAVAMAQIIDRDRTHGQAYNIQDLQSVTFDGLARLCGEAMGVHDIAIHHYDAKTFDFGKNKAFPLREQHFFCGVDKAMRDLEWVPKVSLLEGLKDSYQHDFLPKKSAGLLKEDFTCDDMILSTQSKM